MGEVLDICIIIFPLFFLLLLCNFCPLIFFSIKREKEELGYELDSRKGYFVKHENKVENLGFMQKRKRDYEVTVGE